MICLNILSFYAMQFCVKICKLQHTTTGTLRQS